VKKKKHNYIADHLLVEEEGDEVSAVYGDLVTFLMMLFVLLFVLSYNKNTESEFFVKLQEKMGGKDTAQKQSLTTDHLLLSQLQNFIKKEKLEKYTQILVDEQKIKLILNSPTLFNSGSARLNPSERNAIMALTTVLKGVKNDIIIEGHTDNIPIKSSKYRSNWELSFDRAYSVLKLFINTLNRTPETLSAIGYGEYRPLEPNTKRKGRARNRRIEINIIRITKAK
jgi:chemotaxis protein MotB